MVDGGVVGRVDDILLDERGRPRYLDIGLERARKHVLLPIGQGRVDEQEDVVWVPGMTAEQLEAAPEYTHDVATITREYEMRLDEAYAGEQYRGRPVYGPEPRVVAEGRGAERRLAALGELPHYKVAEGDPDPRGWEVVAGDGKVVGKVAELIVDTAALKVRYLDCDIDEAALGLEEEDRHVLIPIGYARLNEEEKQVITDVVTSEEIARLPRYEGLPLSREYEDRLYAAFTGGAEPHEHPRFNYTQFYGPRAQTH
jgi:photosynthetic reaction center H subunit